MISWYDTPELWDVLHTVCLQPVKATQIEEDTGIPLDKVQEQIRSLLDAGLIGRVSEPGRVPATYAATPDGRESLEPMEGMELPDECQQSDLDREPWEGSGGSSDE